ncbi:MAG: hypothetical protein ACM3SY_09955 [Candidatus Omnitrophota bacterium]
MKLQSAGTTYSQAQVVRWLDENSFIVGRWDGSISIFRKPIPSVEFGPIMKATLLTPSQAGIEMMTVFNPRMFITSNGRDEFVFWWKKYGKYLKKTIPYNPEFGTANSGLFIPGEKLFISGHEMGFLTIWRVNGKTFHLIKSVDLRSPNPIPSPFPVKNIRSVKYWKNNIVITGSDDGDICMVKVPTGEVLFRMRYNSTAQRGINDLALVDNYLLLANCSVGSADKNLWLYTISENQITLLDSYNLIEDPGKPQVFNFSIDLTPVDNRLVFVAGTEEGLLWLGEVIDNQLTVSSKTKIDCICTEDGLSLGPGGAALDVYQDPWTLAAVSWTIRLYTLAIE